jgi:hypothetical protein
MNLNDRWFERGTHVSNRGFLATPTIAAATSSGSTTFPVSFNPLRSSVLVAAGKITDAVTPVSRSSPRTAWVRPTTPNLVALYVAEFGAANRPTADATLMM